MISSPRATASLSLSPGRLAMIVTEYMENGSLDAFLRVRALPTLPFTWAGGGSPVWVSGDHARPPNIPGAWPQQPWGRAARFRVLRVGQSNCLSAPSHVNPCAAQGPAALPWPRVGCPCGDPGPHPEGRHDGCDENHSIPSSRPAVYLLGTLRRRA